MTCELYLVSCARKLRFTIHSSKKRYSASFPGCFIYENKLYLLNMMIHMKSISKIYLVYIQDKYLASKSFLVALNLITEKKKKNLLLLFLE